MRSLTSPVSSPRASTAASPGPDLAALQVVCGSVLCVLRIWTETEWAALSDDERPEQCTYAPGLGWVGAVPVQSLN